MIDAIAGGKQAARRIYSYLQQKEIAAKTAVVHSEIKDYRRERGYESVPREGVPAMPPEERKKAMNLIIEKGFSQTQSMRQAGRCYNCAVNTIFDSEKCILCGGCADVCPENCLKLVSLDSLEGKADFASTNHLAEFKEGSDVPIVRRLCSTAVSVPIMM